jgi:pilus assembly protein TadC
MEKDNNISAQKKTIDRIIAAYKAKKLRLQATEIQSNVSEDEDIYTRMIKGYNKNRNKIENKPKQDIPQAEKRKKKLADLLSRSSSWRGLE